jgi:hypothetical protein
MIFVMKMCTKNTTGAALKIVCDHQAFSFRTAAAERPSTDVKSNPFSEPARIFAGSHS